MKSRTSRQRGFHVGEIMICGHHRPVGAIAIPTSSGARTTSQANACINNLRQIDGATSMGLENSPPAATQ